MAPINYRSGPRQRPARATATAHSPRRTAARTAPRRRRSSRPTSATRCEVHALVTPGSEQMHVFSLGGESFPLDPFLPGSNQVQARGIGPWETLQANIRGGAGGGATVGDMFYGDLRRPFTDAGMWGIQRVLSDASCPIRPLDGRGCTGTLRARSSPSTRCCPRRSSPRRSPPCRPRRRSPRPSNRFAGRRSAQRRCAARGGRAIPVAVAPATCKRSSRLAGRGRPCRPGPAVTITATAGTQGRAEAGARGGSATMIVEDRLRAEARLATARG